MRSKTKQGEKSAAPLHIGIIMDGNRRWAKARLLPAAAGHRAGVKNIVRIVTCAFEYGVRCVTLYAFSTENTGRAKDEVDELVDLIRKRILPMTRELVEKGARVRIVGDRSFFPEDVQEILSQAENENTDIDRPIVNVCLNYSGRSEIVRAARVAAEKGVLTQSALEAELYTAGQPDPDIIIRTGGEKRLSNFLLYQAAYSELFFTDTLWPDFDENELKSIFEQFEHRSRRYGKL